jgi:hypothetical protein
MTRSQKLLVVSGLLLAVWGMGFGMVYAIFFEHQALDRMGASLAIAFILAAQRNIPASHQAIASYGQQSYAYVRQVDAHSHWIGLAMLLIVLAAAFGRLGFEERERFQLALALVIGSVAFPAGVLVEIAGGSAGRMIAVAGAALVIFSLAGVAWGFARPRSPAA